MFKHYFISRQNNLNFNSKGYFYAVANRYLAKSMQQQQQIMQENWVNLAEKWPKVRPGYPERLPKRALQMPIYRLIC